MRSPPRLRRQQGTAGRHLPGRSTSCGEKSHPDNFSLNRLNETLIKEGVMRKFPVTGSERPLYHNVNSAADVPAGLYGATEIALISTWLVPATVALPTINEFNHKDCWLPPLP